MTGCWTKSRSLPIRAEEEVQQYLAVFDLRERLISRLAIFEGMRPGEILALRWNALTIEQRIYKRVFDTPKNGKVREVAISEGTAATSCL